MRLGLGRDIHAPPHQGAETEQGDAEAVFAVVRVLLEHALRHQRGGEPMHGALGDAEPAGERADADIDLVLGEGLEQGDRGGDGGQALLASPRAVAIGPARLIDLAHARRRTIRRSGSAGMLRHASSFSRSARRDRSAELTAVPF